MGTAAIDIPDGAGGQRTVRFLRRRFPPAQAGARTLAEHVITRGDRLDVVTATYLGDPAQYWRVCDANLVIHPGELTAPGRIGGVLRIPVPEA